MESNIQRRPGEDKRDYNYLPKNILCRVMVGHKNLKQLDAILIIISSTHFFHKYAKIDEETKVITKCPAGIKPIHAGVKSGQTLAHFPKQACSMCKLKEKCHAKEQKKDYVVRIKLNSIEAAKQRQKIERTNSALKRGHGLSKLRVRGLVKCTADAGLKILAHNFKRFARYILEQVKKTVPEAIGVSMPFHPNKCKSRMQNEKLGHSSLMICDGFCQTKVQDKHRLT